ncbi:type I pullulanase [Halosquirtibacter xylanolyticus]|uniref:type I pullulanase n=1 Tax=Halosquirtibacter xylanolyticus TaxID=3374599 RepID=UPI0037492B03|nr:type I pullulanase [Prolixibacteraceae bacterium]
MTTLETTNHNANRSLSFLNKKLGISYREKVTTISIWAPSAENVIWRIYDKGTAGRLVIETKLNRDNDGFWEASIQKDLHGFYYTIQVKNHGKWLDEIPDIYAYSTGVNGHRGVIFDPLKTNPPEWEKDTFISLESYTDAVIYEMNIRDFTKHPDSGVEHQGLFLGLTEEATHNSYGESTALSHLEDLGISHAHLLPVSDYCKLDERTPNEGYNWGYDPLNFNTLEGSYATTPYDGLKRVTEFKQLVSTLHKKDIGVVLDVVYNHTGLIEGNYFDQTEPGYFFRHKEDGSLSNASGCGNEFASEKHMARKYLIDSLKYWCEEYHIDGFRFDLMGIYDLETMNIIATTLREINPSILLYGEGWTADTSVLEESKRAVKKNTTLLNQIACFSDDFRDTVKGSQFSDTSIGFISGMRGQEEDLKKAIVGGLSHPQIDPEYLKDKGYLWANNPTQVVNYFSCHDDYTIYDKLKITLPLEEDNMIINRIKLAMAINMLSQGIPFFHSGVELLRTKKGVRNSYNSPDFINQIVWSRKKGHVASLSKYVEHLIQLRKEVNSFRLQREDEIIQRLHFVEDYKQGVVSFILNHKELIPGFGNKILVAFNNNNEIIEQEVPHASWARFDLLKYEVAPHVIPSNKISLSPVSANIFILL